MIIILIGVWASVLDVPVHLPSDRLLRNGGCRPRRRPEEPQRRRRIGRPSRKTLCFIFGCCGNAKFLSFYREIWTLLMSLKFISILRFYKKLFYKFFSLSKSMGPFLQLFTLTNFTCAIIGALYKPQSSQLVNWIRPTVKTTMHVVHKQSVLCAWQHLQLVVKEAITVPYVPLLITEELHRLFAFAITLKLKR